MSAFVRRNQYTIIISSLLLVEIYNKGWEGATHEDDERGARVVHFLSGEHCVITDPLDIWNSEFAALPEKLKRLPVSLNLVQIQRIPRQKALLMFLRRDQVFLDMGKDIAEWDANYRKAKDEWRTGDIKRIMESACNQGYLQHDRNDRYRVLELEQFLASLDMRLAPDDAETSEDRKNFYVANLPHLRAVRLTSLGFLFKYIEYDQGAKPPDNGSDLGDIYFMSVLPWCAVYTTDKNMLVTVKRSAVEAKTTSCKIMGRRELETELKHFKD